MPQLTLAPTNSVLALSGHGIDIRVNRGHLEIEDGVADKRRRFRVSRAERRLKRVFVHGHSGMVTLDAMRWMNDLKIAFVHMDVDGTVLATSTPYGASDPRILRGQVLAVEDGRAIPIVRGLLEEKLRGQLGVLDRLGVKPSLGERLEEQIERVRRAKSMRALSSAESIAAQLYWIGWEGLEVPWVRGARVSDHWRSYPGRRASKAARNFKAVDPLNAVLNYLYGVLEAESRLAVVTLGLDPRLGLLHADRRWRNSLALDVMEPVRPEVDSWLLNLLDGEQFTPADFFERRDGVCRILPPLTEILIETCELWRASLGPIAESVARALLKAGVAGSDSRKAPGWRRSPRAVRPVTTALTGDTLKQRSAAT
jgi:CRISPR-associated endonuclease Cas1